MNLDVLIVDDHEPMRALLRTVLERAGAMVRTAESGAEAMGLLDEGGADLVICDQNMPGMSGTELVQTLRADARHARARVIMVSGRAEAAFTEAARSAGVDRVLVKPILPSTLIATIADLMRAAA